MNDWKNAVLFASFHDETIFNFCNLIMLRQARKIQRSDEDSSSGAGEVIRKNGLSGLEVVGTEVFPGKKNMTRVIDAQGRVMILKTGRINPLESRLLLTAKDCEKHLRFKVPTVVDHGDGWILMEEVKGTILNEFFNSEPDRCVDMSRDIADDYQLVIRELQKTQRLGDLLQEGEEWLFSMLNLWSKPIIDAGLIDFHLVRDLASELRRIIDRRGERVFGWFHGNIIGDHVIVSDDGDIYLLDLDAVPRFGRGYHDFLRAIDFMLLKSEKSGEMFEALPRWIDRYLSEFNRHEVMIVLAFRMIGILGWDILHHQAGSEQPGIEAKKRLIARFIRDAVY